MEEVFWANVKALLEKQGISQKTLADQCGMNYGTLQNKVSQHTLPRADEAVRIARALHTSVEYLVTGEEAAPCAVDKDKLIKAIAKAVNDAVP